MDFTVRFAVDGALVEDHDILGQSSSFVTKDVFNLAQLLVQRGGPSLGGRVAVSMVHLPVPVDVEAVPQANNLHADKSSRCFLINLVLN